MMYEIQGLTRGQLEQRVTPNKAAGDMEAVPQALYDTQTYVSAATVSLTFFVNAAAAGLWLTNMTQAGQLPNPDFFIIQYISLDVLGLPPANSGNLADMYGLLYGTGAAGAPYGVFNFASKPYGPWPLSQFHGTGGPTGFTTRTGVEYANNGIPGSPGVWIGGAITLPPLQAFSLNVQWSAPVTLNAGNVQLRMGLWGTYYRTIH